MRQAIRFFMTHVKHLLQIGETPKAQPAFHPSRPTAGYQFGDLGDWMGAYPELLEHRHDNECGAANIDLLRFFRLLAGSSTTLQCKAWLVNNIHRMPKQEIEQWIETMEAERATVRSRGQADLEQTYASEQLAIFEWRGLMQGFLTWGNNAN